MSDLYRELIIDHYKNPRNVGEVSDPDIHGHEDNTVCGDTVTISIHFNAEDVVADVKWSGEGCALSQASASLLTELIKGKTREEVVKISEQDILDVVGAQLNPSRKKCATLPLHALHKGLTQ